MKLRIKSQSSQKLSYPLFCQRARTSARGASLEARGCAPYELLIRTEAMASVSVDARCDRNLLSRAPGQCRHPRSRGMEDARWRPQGECRRGRYISSSSVSLPRRMRLVVVLSDGLAATVRAGGCNALRIENHVGSVRGKGYGCTGEVMRWVRGDGVERARRVLLPG